MDHKIFLMRTVRHFAAWLLLSAGLCFGQGQTPAPPVTTSQLILPLSTQLQPVSSATATVVGNPGPGTYFYWLVANYPVGSTSPAGPFVLTGAPNTLSGSNYNQIIPTYPAGVTSLDLLRTLTPTQPIGVCNCAVATGVTSGTINDQSASLSGYTVTPFSPASFGLTLGNEVVGSGSTHLILRQNGVQVADLSNIGASGVTGSGTLGMVPLWSASTALGNSAISQAAGTVSIADNLSVTGNQVASGSSTASQFIGTGAVLITSPIPGSNFSPLASNSRLAVQSDANLYFSANGGTFGLLPTVNGTPANLQLGQWISATQFQGKSWADLDSLQYVAGGGTAQAQTVTLASPATSLIAGLEINFLPIAANTGATPTLAVNGLTAKPITKLGTGALIAGDLSTTAIASVIYDGTEFQLQNPQAAGSSVSTTQGFETAGNASNVTASYLFCYNTLPTVNADRGAAWAAALATPQNGVANFCVDARPEIATNIAVASNPLTGSPGGQLLLPPGTINTAVGWQLPNGANGMLVQGEGPSGITLLRACAAGVAGCASDMTLNPAGQITAVIGMGPTTPANGADVVGSRFKDLTVEANGVPGVMGDAVTAGQEMNEQDHVNLKDSALVQFDIGEGTNSVQNGGAFHDFYAIMNPAGSVYNPCPTAVTQTITSISNTTGNIATVVLSGAPTPALQTFMQTNITGQSNGGTHGTVYNGLREIASVISSTSFTFKLNAGGLADSATGNGTVQTGPIGFRAFSAPNGGGRDFVNGTIVAAGCNASFTNPLIAMSFSGGPWEAHNIHAEDALYGAAIGIDGNTRDIRLSHFSPVTNVVNGVLISNQWATSNIDIDMLVTTQGGGTPNTTSLIDLINSNTLTPTNNGHLGHYWLDSAAYPWTTANPVGGTEIANGFVFYNGTFSIYNAGALKFSANNSGAATATSLALGAGAAMTTVGWNNTATAHNLGLYEGAATAQTLVPPSATALPLVSNGAAADPAFQLLTVVGGGTGLATLTAHAVQVGEGTSTPAQIGPSATTGLPLLNNAGADPGYGVLGVVGGGTGINTCTLNDIITGGGGTSNLNCQNAMKIVAGVATVYNGNALVDLGLPSELGHADLTGQTAAKTATTLCTPTATGRFRISAYLKITTAGTSPVLGPVTITYTDGTDSVAQSGVMAMESQTGANGTSNAGNTTVSTLDGVKYVYALTGVAIQYAIALTGTVGSGAYEAHLTCESM